VKKLDSKKAIPLTIKSFGQELKRGEMAEMIYRLKNMVTNLPSVPYSDLK